MRAARDIIERSALVFAPPDDRNGDGADRHPQRSTEPVVA